MLAFIDCYINEPVKNSIDEYIDHNSIPYTYHSPAKTGMYSLKSLSKAPSKIIILGSISNVTDKEPWHKELLNYVTPQLFAGTPVLGICFGHQLMATYFGSKIEYANCEKKVFKEKRNITIANQGFGLQKDQIIPLAFAHQQIVKELGKDLREVGFSTEFRNEIICHSSLPFLGTQAHPEASIKFLLEDSLIQTGHRDLQKSGHKFIDQFLLHSL